MVKNMKNEYFEHFKNLMELCKNHGETFPAVFFIDEKRIEKTDDWVAYLIENIIWVKLKDKRNYFCDVRDKIWFAEIKKHELKEDDIVSILVTLEKISSSNASFKRIL